MTMGSFHSHLHAQALGPQLFKGQRTGMDIMLTLFIKLFIKLGYFTRSLFGNT